MAEKIESGRVQIASVGGVPMQQVQQRGIDYVGYRAQAQTNNTMAQILDRMSSSVNAEAGRLRQQEAIQFAAQNPITPEQLEAAKNGDMTELNLSTNPVSIFGNAVRKARSLELSSHFEIEGRNELVKLLADIESGATTTEQVQTKIATMTDGYTKSLAEVDGDAAFKFRATMATHGNTVLNEAYKTQLKRSKAERIAKFDMDFDNVTRLLETTVSQSPGEVDAIADVMRKNVMMQSMLLGDAGLQKEYSAKFEQALQGAKIAALTKELTGDVYMANPIATLDKIRKGEAGNLSPVLQGLIANDFNSVAKVTANFMVAVNNRDSLARQQRDAQTKAGEAAAINLLEMIFPLPESDPRRKAMIAQLTELPPGSVPIGTLKDLLDPSGEGNSAVEFNILNGIYGGSITTSDQIWKNPSLNGAQKIRLLKTLNSEDRRDSAELDRGIARLAGIPVMPGSVTVIDPKGEQFQRLNQLRGEAQQIVAAATVEGKVMTPRQILESLEKSLTERRNSEAAKAAKRTLEVYEKEKWINGPINRETLPALEKKAGNDRNKLLMLNQIKKKLNEAEGVQ